MKGTLTNDQGHTKKVKIGFSWTTFFFGAFVPLFRKDWLVALPLFAIILFTAVFNIGYTSWIAWVIVAFFYNKQYINSLLAKGYKPTDETFTKKLIEKNIIAEDGSPVDEKTKQKLEKYQNGEKTSSGNKIIMTISTALLVASLVGFGVHLSDIDSKSASEASSSKDASSEDTDSEDDDTDYDSEDDDTDYDSEDDDTDYDSEDDDSDYSDYSDYSSVDYILDAAKVDSADAIANAQKYSYALLLKSDAHAGEPYHITGTVLQANSTDDGSEDDLLVDVTGSTDLIKVTILGTTDAVADSTVNISGIIGERETYDTQGGGTNTVPTLYAVSEKVTVQ